MKYIAVVFGLAAIVSAAQETFKLPQDKLLNIQKKGTECAAESNVDPGNLDKLIDGTLPTDEAADKFAYCVGLKIALVDENGHIIIEKISGYLGDHPLVEKFKEAIRKCNEATKDTPVATVGAVYRCYISTAPVRFIF